MGARKMEGLTGRALRAFEAWKAASRLTRRGLLEAWLERVWGADWRRRADPAADSGAAAPAAGGPMSREEALSILGLEAGASPEAVREAHRRLMTRVHPDHGGSTWLAAKLNQARDLLLKLGAE